MSRQTPTRFGISKLFQDGRQLLEPEAETAALARGGFQENGNRRLDRIQRPLERPGDSGHTRFDAGAHMRPGMHYQTGHSQIIGAFHFFDECIERFPAQIAVRGCKINEIAVVRYHGIDAAFSMGLPKQDPVLFRQMFCLPLVAALEEDLNGFAADLFAALESQVHAPCNGHVGACQQFFHRVRLK